MRFARLLAPLLISSFWMLAQVGVTLAASAERFDAARLRIAPSSYRQMKLERGIASITPEGLGWAEFRYAAPNTGARSRRILKVSVHWVEKAAAGQKQKRLFPRMTTSGTSASTFSATHQINISISSVNPREIAASEGLPLARDIATSLQRRALPWGRYLLAFRPPERVQGHVLRWSHVYFTNDRNGYRSIELKYQTLDTDSDGRWLAHRQKMEIDMKWQEPPQGGRPPATKWKMTEAAQRAQRARGPLGTVEVHSATHKVFSIIRGEHWDDRQKKWVKTFQTRDHRDLAVRLARQFMAVAEKEFAERKSGGMATNGSPPGIPAGPTIGWRGSATTNRLPPAGDPANSSGTIAAIQGPARIIRGGRPVSVAAGGRIAKGDVILVGKDGKVAIRFDDPRAGPEGAGVLVAGQGKHVIDVAPSPTDPRVQVDVQEGRARFVHPSGGAIIEVGLSIGGALFGQVTGTDILAASDPERDVAVIAVREGRARVKTLPTGKETSSEIAGQWTIVNAGQVLRRYGAGRPVLENIPQGAYAGYTVGLEPSADQTTQDSLGGRSVNAAIAIAWNDAGDWWANWSMDLQKSRAVALENCSRKYGNCRIAAAIAPGSRQCVAIAQGSGNKQLFSWASEQPLQSVRQRALRNCEQTTGSECQLKFWRCNY